MVTLTAQTCRDNANHGAATIELRSRREQCGVPDARADLQTAAPCTKGRWSAAFLSTGSIHQSSCLCNSDEDWHQLLKALHVYASHTASISKCYLPKLQITCMLTLHAITVKNLFNCWTSCIYAPNHVTDRLAKRVLAGCKVDTCCNSYKLLTFWLSTTASAGSFTAGVCGQVQSSTVC